jgi:hypothetical protein
MKYNSAHLLSRSVFSVVCLASIARASAQLAGPGDIAIVGWNADANDDLAFVTLVDLPQGTSITFSDQEWDGAAFSSGEGDISWLADNSVPAGTVITLSNLSTDPMADVGSLGTGEINLAATNESLFVYFVNPQNEMVFLTACTVDSSDGLATLEGTGLEFGETAIDFAQTEHKDADVLVYAGPRDGEGQFSDFARRINDPMFWLADDGSGDQSADGTPPDLPFENTPFELR